MKKILFVFSGIIICLLAIVLIVNSFNKSDKIIYKNSNEDSKSIINSNALTMMYETDYQSGEYQVSIDTIWPQEGYAFNEQLSSCENGSTLRWDDENKRVIMSASVSDKCYVYFDKTITFVEYILTEIYSGVDGANGLYYHDGVGTYTNANQETGDNSYRYSRADPNNYVCFGTDETPCPYNNLYRIIGAFDIVDGYAIKLIDSRVRRSGNLNNLYITLDVNEEYLKEIYTVDWKTGGVDYSYGTRTPKTVYNYELGAASSVTTESSQVYLMYLSDYGYAASPEYWTTNLGSYSNAADNNWLFIESSGWPDEWTISRRSDSSSWAWAIDNMGNIEFEATGTNSAIRRCFYLKSDVLYISDDGTQSNPFRIG